MSLPPVIERLRQRIPPTERRQWIRGTLFNWETKLNAQTWRFRELFSRFAVELKESSVRLAELPVDAKYWTIAPRSQSFEDLLSHFLQAEFQQKATDGNVLWSLAGLAVDRCDNEFGRQYWIGLCIEDPKNVRWLVESAIWVLYNSGHDTTRDLRETLKQLERKVPRFRRGLRKSAEGMDHGLAEAALVALEIEKGRTVIGWRHDDPERWGDSAPGQLATVPLRTAGEGPPFPAYTANYGSALFPNSFLRELERAQEVVADIVGRATGVDITNHSPDQLRVIDRLLGPSFRDRVKKDPKIYESTTIVLGAYLGEVIVRNLDGQWHLPNYLQTLVIRGSRDKFKGERYWYVRLTGRKAYVFRAAREAIDKTAEEFSLHEFYRRWALAARIDGMA